MRLTTDLLYIPESTIERSVGKDGKKHYRCDYSIKMTSCSASTKYELVYRLEALLIVSGCSSPKVSLLIS